MCIVIDANAVSSVFLESVCDHDDFAPVLQWIIEGRGKIVIGGKTYNEEVFVRMSKYIGLFTELQRSNKIVKIDDDVVDDVEKSLVESHPDEKIQDAHLIAIIISSKCRLICTKDGRSFESIKNPKYYPHGVTKPSLYTSKRNKDLLCEDNIAECCMPKVRLNKHQRKQLGCTEIVFT